MDIAAWLKDLGLARYAQAFRDNDIDTRILPSLSADDLKELGVASLGHRKQLLEAIAALRAPVDAAAGRADAGPRATPPREAERRQLTVLFCDLVGSTALAATFDPEDMGAVIRAYHGCCSEAVERWGGQVAKYLGDGVLAYFGWPQAHEDDAERAVRAGLAITEAVAGLATPGGEPLATRVGIATGLVMVGELIGAGAAQEQTVVGETPNLAARLQALAEPGSVVISQATRRLVGGLFELTDLGPHPLKGFAEPLAVWRVEGEGRAEGRFEALHGEHLTPLVGREHELGILLERWAWAKDGDGQVVLLAGEPGIGKSRLIRALRERLAGEPYTPLSHYCSPYHTNSALHPVIGLLERAARLERDEAPEAKLAKLEAVLNRSSDRLDEAVPLLAALLGVPTGARYPALTMTPELQKRRTLQALVDQLARLAAQQPVLALYEDAHWIDPSTLELLGLVIERIRQLPVLALITFRPEFQPPWTGHAHVTTLPMSRLGRRQGADLIARVTGNKPLPAEVVEQIVARTDGVPLFVEELTKTVLESGLLADQGDHHDLAGPLPPLAIPATLHDSLMARLDRLAPVKEIAQIGAVIGREFSHALLATVSPLPEEKLGCALEQLVQSELVFRRGAPPEATYSFKHALVQDAAYASLLLTRRRQLHAMIVACLEERFPEIADAQPVVLAHHHHAAGQSAQAFGYWIQAGRQAAERFANREAVEHLTKARDALNALPAGQERDRRELDLLMILGPALLAIEGFAATDAEPLYLRARALCADLGDRDRDLAAIQALRTFYMVRGQLAAATAQGEELLELGERSGSRIYRFEGHRALGIVARFSGHLAAARNHLEEALNLYNPARLPSFMHQPHGHPGVITLAHLSQALELLGFAEQAEHRRRDAFELAHELAHRSLSRRSSDSRFSPTSFVTVLARPEPPLKSCSR